MIWTLLPYVLVAGGAFVAGLLVGRRNPKVADMAANVADQAAKKL